MEHEGRCVGNRVNAYTSGMDFHGGSKARNPGGGRKKLKPEYNAGKNLKEQMDAAVIRYKDGMTLQAIADALSLNPIKVRKLLITAGIYESDIARMNIPPEKEIRKT